MLEELGKRTVVLCTTPFDVTSRNIARVLGLPEYPFALLEHPLGSLTHAEVEARADEAAMVAEQILLQE